MNRLILLGFAMMLGMLALFALANALDVSLLVDPSPAMQRGGRVLGGALGVGLLVGDVVLPVPSSLVMVYLGRLYGTVGGTMLNLLGGVGAAWLAALIGRRGGPWLTRLASPAEMARAERWCTRWGMLAVVVTRPIPMVAETVGLFAGATRMSPGRLTLATVLGHFPGAVAYAWAGAHATTMVDTFLILVAVLALAGLAWVIGQRLGQSPV